MSSATMAGMATVLVVDDELRITRLVRDYLRQAGFGVVEASDGPSALEAAGAYDLDLVVLDLGLPGMDGLDVMRQLRADSTVPIIVVTARTDESDRIVGLELGADDYVVKPFSPKELVARVRAVLRHVGMTVDDRQTLQVGPVTVDLPKMRVTVDGVDVDLTATEFQLVATLAGQPGRVFTRAQLLDAVHGVAFDSYERAVDAHIKNIRRKLEPDPRRPVLIQTVHGVGYRFRDA